LFPRPLPITTPSVLCFPLPSEAGLRAEMVRGNPHEGFAQIDRRLAEAFLESFDFAERAHYYSMRLRSRADILGSVGVEFAGLSDLGCRLIIDIISDDLIALSVENHYLILTLAVLLLNRLDGDIPGFGRLFSSGRRRLRSSRLAGSFLSGHIEARAFVRQFFADVRWPDALR
jgi:hypothetical protein